MPRQEVWNSSVHSMELWKGFFCGFCSFVFLCLEWGAMRNRYHAQGKKLKRCRKSIKDVFKRYTMVRVCFSNRLFSCQVWWTHWRTRNWTVGDQLQQLKGDLRTEQGGGGGLEGTDEKAACVLWVGGHCPGPWWQKCRQVHFDGWEGFRKPGSALAPQVGWLPREIHGTQRISSWRCLPVWFVHSLSRLFLFPQECPEGWDLSGLIRGLRQKKQSKGWMARSPVVLRNRLLWSLPTTPARSPARPCSPSSTSPPTGATPAHFTTRLRGSGRRAHGGKSPATRVLDKSQGNPRPWSMGRGENLCL